MARSRRLKARDRADTLFAAIVRKRDGHCVRCGAYDGLECAHIVRRGFDKTRCDLGNAVTLCGRCHRHFTANPDLWRQWVDDSYPGLYRSLHVMATDPNTPKVDWPSVLAELKQEAKRWNL